MKKLLLLPILLLTCCSTQSEEIEVIARYENVYYNIAPETGELTVVYGYYENKDEGVLYNAKEYKTMNYVYARFLSVDTEKSNAFYIRRNAPDLLVAYYHHE